MWEQEEFEKHWRNEFPDGEVPVMNLRSVADIEAELEKCKANLKMLQQALSEEKFKVIYLQTTIAQKKRSYDGERWCNRTEHEPERGNAKAAPDVSRGSKTGKPILVPPRKKPDVHEEHSTSPREVSQPDGKRVSERRDSDSDHDYEDEQLNENFVQRNIVNPKRNARGNLLVRMSRDLDSDDGRLSPSVALRGFHGSGRSTPDRRSDGYLSSEHDDSSSVGRISNKIISSSIFSRKIDPIKMCLRTFLQLNTNDIFLY